MAIIMGKGCIEAIYGLMGWKGLSGRYSNLPLHLNTIPFDSPGGTFTASVTTFWTEGDTETG